MRYKTKRCKLCGCEYAPASGRQEYCAACGVTKGPRLSRLGSWEGVCKECGDSFTPERGSVSERCPVCRAIYEPKTCEVCGCAYVPTGQQKYCQECRHTAWRASHAEWARTHPVEIAEYRRTHKAEIAARNAEWARTHKAERAEYRRIHKVVNA